MANRRAFYVVYAALPDGTILPAADLGLETDDRGRHGASGLRYRNEWLQHPRAFALNPVHAPLRGDATEWVTVELPAVIDEVQPGHWERQVLARARQQAGQGIDPDDLHAVLGADRYGFRVGAIEIVPRDAPAPALGAPLALAELEQLAAEADMVARHQEAELAALQRLQAGSTIGGARPKVVVHDETMGYVAKLTRARDPFNHPRVEHVGLELARRAGLEVPASRIASAGRLDALLVTRFDLAPAGGRYHLVSANSLLKDPETQADPVQPRYEDLVRLVQACSDDVATDLRALYARMLFNEAFHNIDDHLRNFSFIRDEDGFRLGPVYDLVPTDHLGAYPSLVFGHGPGRPHPGDAAALDAARTFQLPPREATGVIERLREAFRALPAIMEEAGLSDADRRLLERVVWRPR